MIRTTRCGLLIITVVMSAGATWSVIAPSAVPVPLTVVAAVILLCAAALLWRSAEVQVSAERILIRPVLRPQRALACAELDEIVALRLLLPSRSGGADGNRLVLRSGGRTIAAFSPLRTVPATALDVTGVTVTQVMTPRKAGRR